MAFVATTNTAPAERPSIIARSFASIGAFFVAYSEARSRHGQIEALNALSDEELAELGITRDAIVSHVFSDRFYL